MERKEQILQDLMMSINTGIITKEDVVERLKISKIAKISVPEETQTKKNFSFSLNTIFYILGTVLIIFGIVIFANKIWDNISNIVKILLTLGSGILFAGLGTIFIKKKPENNIGIFLHFIGGFLIPIGIFVTLEIFKIEKLILISFIFGGMAFFYLVLSLLQRKAVLTFFAITNITLSCYLFVIEILSLGSWINGQLTNFTIFMGVFYIFLAQGFKNTYNKSLIGLLNFTGTLFLLGGTFTKIIDSTPWQVLYLLLLISMFFLSSNIKSRAILLLSTIFMIIYVSYISSVHFADSLGWPITLVIIGTLLIFIGYISFTINQRIKTNK